MAARIAASQRVWDDDERDGDFTEGLALGVCNSLEHTTIASLESVPQSPHIFKRDSSSARVFPAPASAYLVNDVGVAQSAADDGPITSDNKRAGQAKGQRASFTRSMTLSGARRATGATQPTQPTRVRTSITRSLTVPSLSGMRSCKSRIGLDRQRSERKLTFEERMGGAASAEKYREQVQHIRNHIKLEQRARRRVIHPLRSRYVPRWDVVTTLALIYTATLTPFEAAFLEPTLGPEAWSSGWFLVNRCLDAIFLLDLTLQFFLAYLEVDTYGGQSWVFDHWKIVRRYLTSWFPLDASTILLPGAFDLYMTTLSDTDGGPPIDLSVLRVMRVLRLIKLVRLVRASRVYERWKSRIVLSYSTQVLLQCIGMLIVAAHWCACLFAMQAGLHPEPLKTSWWRWWRADAEASVEEPPADFSAGGSGAYHHEELKGLQAADGKPSAGEHYIAAVCWSLMVVTGTG